MSKISLLLGADLLRASGALVLQSFLVSEHGVPRRCFQMRDSLGRED
jgi:hypothetical protein